MTEEWRPIVGYEDRYEISSLGRVRTLPRILSPSCGSHGYPAVSLSKNKKSQKHSVHVLVLEAFVGPRPSGHQVLHKNGDRTDSKLENLRWGTPAENTQDRYRHGTVFFGDEHWNTKVSDADVARIREAIAFGAVQEDLVDVYGVCRATISAIKHKTSRFVETNHAN